ncbi:MAG: 16S rRNA methylase [Microgenomates group bacterium GW2011_GWA2_44_7]|nr:MAG: 16S rRNA methylase [Microgenomates group bacterium GW2011_GWA2_44_7]KKT77910.1 MAG: 16S rRNA methylase [Microgenomates group bacterium GW2011_GWB1_44_8]
MTGIILDIGTGDGEFVYQLAKANPDRFIIGIDPNQKNLEKTSARLYKKTAKGGLKNALYVLASIEDLPEELNGLANQIFINFPWGSLLGGITEPNEKIWKNLRRVSRPGAIIDILLPAEQMPISEEWRQRLVKGGFRVERHEQIDADHLKSYPSEWAKRLAFGRDRHFLHLRIIV